jgi:hypothetical protein
LPSFIKQKSLADSTIIQVLVLFLGSTGHIYHEWTHNGPDRVCCEGWFFSKGRSVAHSRRGISCNLETGAALLEFAVIVPFLITLLVGLVNVGLALYEKQIVTQAARAAAHYVSTLINDVTPAPVLPADRSISNSCNGVRAFGTPLDIAQTVACNHLAQANLELDKWEVKVSIIDLVDPGTSLSELLVEVELLRTEPACFFCFENLIKSYVKASSTF